MEITKEMLSHYGVGSKDELDDLILTDSDAYHAKTESWYKGQADTRLAETHTAEMKAKIEASGYDPSEIEMFAKEMGATGINSNIIEAYAKLNPKASGQDTVTSTHQLRDSARTIEGGKRVSSDPDTVIDQLLNIKDTLL